MESPKTDDVYSGEEFCAYCQRFFHTSEIVLVAGKYVFCNNSPSGCRERYQLAHTEVHVSNGTAKYYKEAPEDLPLFPDDLPDHRPLIRWLNFSGQPRKRVS